MLRLTAFKISLSLLFLKWIKNEIISRTRDTLKFYNVSGATFYDCVHTIYQFINFSWIKMSIFEEYGAFIKVN